MSTRQIIMSVTIAALVGMALSAAAQAAPTIQKAAADFVAEQMRNGNFKALVKTTDWKAVRKDIKSAGNDIKEIAKETVDYANYKDSDGGWEKK